jgi:hypothetical protein
MNATKQAISVIVVFYIGILGNTKTDSIDCVVQKSVLLEKLDSIDMEKQILKRKGLSLEELEKKTLVIKDSIAAIKNSIKQTNEVAPLVPVRRAAEGRLWQVNRFLPRNTFDWIVLILAGIALIAGAILCIGLISMLLKTMTTKKKPPLKTMGEKLSLRSEHTSYQDASPREKVGPEISEKKLDSLKKRMSEESKSPVAPINAPFADSPAQGYAQPMAKNESTKYGSEKKDIFPLPSHDVSPAPLEVKTQIIKAALEGADPVEISKRFHVSADQVALILRVSQQKNK